MTAKILALIVAIFLFGLVGMIIYEDNKQCDCNEFAKVCKQL